MQNIESINNIFFHFVSIGVNYFSVLIQYENQNIIKALRGTSTIKKGTDYKTHS